LLTSLLPQAGRKTTHDEGLVLPEEAGTATDEVSDALFEAEEAISAVMSGATPVSLAPQGSYVRRLQHQLADRYNLGSRSRGKEPNRRVEIFREGMQ
jgi:hypothetical protein